MTKLLGVGSALVDLLVHVPESFIQKIPGRKGGMQLVDFDQMQGLLSELPANVVRAPGGSAANTVVGAAHLGLATRMLAKTGSDADGRFYRQALAGSGVDVGGFKTHDTEGTGKCLSLITPDSQRTMRTYLGASQTLGVAEVTEADFTGCTHVHIEGYLLFNRALMLRILQVAKGCGCVISLDLAAPEVVAATRDVLPELLTNFVSTVFANEDEANEFCGGRGEKAGLDELAACCELAVVKLGVRGAMIKAKSQNAVIQVPAHVVNAVDTTGAGDLWAAGFLYGWLNGAELSRAADMGARVAAAVVQVTGAVISSSEWDRLRRECRL